MSKSRMKRQTGREAAVAFLLRAQIDQMLLLIRTKEAEVASLMRQGESAAAAEANLPPEKRIQGQQLLNAGRNMQSVLNEFKVRFEAHAAELRKIESSK